MATATPTKQQKSETPKEPKIQFVLSLVGAHRVLNKVVDGKKELVTKTVGSSNWALRDSILEDNEVAREDVINECFDPSKVKPFGRTQNGFRTFRQGDLIGFLNSEGEVAIEALYTKVNKGFSKDGYAEVTFRAKRTEEVAAVKKINTDGEVVETVTPAVKKKK